MTSADPVPVLKPEAWPQDLARAWTRARRSAATRYRGTAGSAAHWRPATVATVERAVGLWLGWCATHDRPMTLPDPNVIPTYVDWLIETRGYAATTLTRDIGALAMFAQAIAPDDDQGFLRDLARQCKQRERQAPRPLADTRGRVRADSLEALGRSLIAGAEAKTRPGIYTAIQYRDGLMLVILARRAPRRRNLMAIRIGEELRLDGRARLVFPPGSTKGGRRHELGLAALRPELEAWLERWRPIFGVPRDSGPMWPAQDGRALHPKAASRRVGDLTERHLGLRITMHGARHALATTLSDHRADGVTVAATLLNHARKSTTAQSYVRRADALVAQQRAETLLQAVAGTTSGISS